MKTPDQIAQAIADAHDFAAVEDLRSPEQVHDMITQAIEADRAQRAKADVEEGIREFREEQRSLATLHAVQIHDLAERLDEDAANMTDEDQASDLSAACEALHHYAEIIEPYEDDD